MSLFYFGIALIWLACACMWIFYTARSMKRLGRSPAMPRVIGIVNLLVAIMYIGNGIASS